MANWDDVKWRLDRLRELDRAPARFGASTHMYLTNPVAESELRALERDLGVRLPADFRGFLLEIGYGAGPYYGIYSPTQLLDEVRDGLHLWMEDSDTLAAAWDDYVKALGTWPVPAVPCWIEWVAQQERSDHTTARSGWPTPDRPFPFTRAGAETIPQGWAWQAVLESSFPVPGCVLIGNQGCAYYTVLITAGELTGSVWDLCHDPEGCGVWVPARCASENSYREPPHLPLVPTFREWYTGWIEASLADLQSIEQDVADARARVEAALKERGPCWGVGPVITS